MSSLDYYTELLPDAPGWVVVQLAEERDALQARIAALRATLARLRDCDFVIRLPDRMDAVRDIARDALNADDKRP